MTQRPSGTIINYIVLIQFLEVRCMKSLDMGPLRSVIMITVGYF